jgi:plastocyanin
VVFGILGTLFFVRGATGAPRINDHWHATYSVFICGQRQPNFPTWEGGVHTHADGVIHIHPFTPQEEGAGARLVKWFEYGGGKLTQTEMRMPGDRREFKNGDLCDDGSEAVLQVFVNGQKMSDWSRYIPQDGDQIRIVFGPEEEAIEESEGIIIAPEEADREIAIEASDRGQPEADSFFNPDTFTAKTGETVKVNVENTGTVTHNLRVEGVDKVYETEDDFVTRAPDQESSLIQPGEEGFLVVRIDQPGEYAFRCDIHRDVQFGTMIVAGEAPAEEEGTPTPAAQDTAEP